MSEQTIYQDIAERTGGDVYVGVAGPVRSGKSTFIKRFMETLVLPNITDAGARERARDELPQSAGGKTVMTTEPKFIPEEAVPVTLGGGAQMRMRLIDCVGYLIPGAMGSEEDGKTRLVHTPWQEEPMPFAEAAELGTHKVISEHSTIGMLVTADGSFGELPRDSYVEAEERIVRELKELGKTFAVILNSAHPGDRETQALALSLEEKYEAPVALVDCLDLDEEDVRHVMGLLLDEFPIREIRVGLPAWVTALDRNHRVRTAIRSAMSKGAEAVGKMGELPRFLEALSSCEYLSEATLLRREMGKGSVAIGVSVPQPLYFETVSELTGIRVAGEEELITTMRELAEVKKKYDKISEALREVGENGYGIVMPSVDDLRLEEPQIVKQAGGYGVRLRAGAESIHLIRANIEAEINPVVGTEQQSEDLVKYLLREFEENPRSIWESNLFGKSLYELMNEGLHSKLAHIPAESRKKLSETLERIVNEGSNGLICILL